MLLGSVRLVMHGFEQGLQSLAASQKGPIHGAASHSMTVSGGISPWHLVTTATDWEPVGDVSTHCTTRVL